MNSTPARLVVFPPIGSDADAVAELELPRLGAVGNAARIVEYPGHGGIPRQAAIALRDIADKAAVSEDEPFDAVGIAMGAYVVAELLVHHPARLRSAILVSSPVTGISEEQRTADRARARESEHGIAGLVEPTLRRWFTASAVARDDRGVALARDRLKSMEPGVWSDYWLAIADRVSLTQRQGAGAPLPVSIVVPLHDAPANQRALASARDLLPHSRVLHIDGPHMVSLERPANLLAAIDNHLEWVASGAPARAVPLYLAGQ